jgi:hypothetical protein
MNNDDAFDGPVDFDAWIKLSAKARMQRTFRFLATVVADRTKQDRATQLDSKEALIKVSELLKKNLWMLERSQLSDTVFKEIQCALLCAFEIGKISGFIDKGAERPGRFIRAWSNQQKSAEAKREKAEAWKDHVFNKAKIICDSKTEFISQDTLATKILDEDWPQGVKKLSRKKLIETISEWDKSGELKRSKKSTTIC